MITAIQALSERAFILMSANMGPDKAVRIAVIQLSGAYPDADIRAAQADIMAKLEQFRIDSMTQAAL